MKRIPNFLQGKQGRGKSFILQIKNRFYIDDDGRYPICRHSFSGEKGAAGPQRTSDSGGGFLP